MSKSNIILFHYTYSPFARRVAWYLTLRGISYAQCIQPPIMPREDISALGVAYRRIPILSIGRDIYCDTRLILRKLEASFPDGAIGARGGEQRAIERLLERWTVDGGVFSRAASLIPLELPNMNDPAFIRDREQWDGRSWQKEDMARARPEALVHVRDAFDLLETTLLADGRDWVLKTQQPSLADIEAIWPLDWLAGLKGALAPSVVSEMQFPKVFAWMRRFRSALKGAKESQPKPLTITGAEAAKNILGAAFVEPEGEIDENDPLGLEKGEVVEVWPIESGFSHHDRGRLVTLTAGEVTVATRSTGGQEVHLHFPRWGFRVARASDGSAARVNL